MILGISGLGLLEPFCCFVTVYNGSLRKAIGRPSTPYPMRAFPTRKSSALEFECDWVSSKLAQA